MGFIIGGTYRKATSLPGVWPIVCGSDMLPCNGTVKVTGSPGSWQLVELTIPPISENDWALGYQYAHYWVGCYPTGQVWVDDIRFAPVNSLVSTTYYDSKWQQPILSVNENNNPGKKVTYDNFGRPVNWNKVDKNSAGTTMTEEKKYSLMSDLFFDDFEGSPSTLVNNATSYSYSTPGYNSARCAIVPIPAGGSATFGPPDAIAVQLAGKAGTLSWNYNIASGYYTGVVKYQVGGVVYDLSTFTFTGTGSWNSTCISIDFSSIPSVQKILVQVSSGTGVSMYVDNFMIAVIPSNASLFALDPSKWYKIVSILNENYCMQVDMTTYSPPRWRATATPLEQSIICQGTYKNSANQLWKFAPAYVYYNSVIYWGYNIVNRGGDQLYSIDDPYLNPTASPIKIWAPLCVNQLWQVVPATQGYCTITCPASPGSPVIGMVGNSVSEGGRLNLQTAGSNNSQEWKIVEVSQFRPDPTKWYYIINKYSGTYLSITSHLCQTNQPIGTETNTNSDYQQWKFDPVDNGDNYFIYSKCGGQMLDHPHGSFTNPPIWVGTWNVCTNYQKWSLISDGFGYQKIACHTDNYSVIERDASGRAKITTDVNNDYQKWQIIEAQ